MTRSRRLLVVGLGVALLAACGTTVPESDRAAVVAGSGPQAGNGLTAPGDGATAGQPAGDNVAAGGGVAPAGTNAPTGSGGGAGSFGVGGTTGSSAAGGSGTTVSARGLTATQINIGVVTEQDAANLGKQLGAESLVGGDHVAEIDALVKQLNSQGGIAGRKVVPVYQDVKTADATSDPASAAQSACSGLTEDKQVFAVVSIVGAVNNDTMYGCMQKHHTPYFGVDLVPHHRSQFAKYAPYAYGAHTVSLERLLPTQITRLRAQQYFSGWDAVAGAPAATPAKIGILYIDKDPGYLQLMQKTLRAVGLQETKTFGYRDELQSLSADMQSAVLSFRSAGVTHVLIEESDGVLFFLPQADNQNYRPRYGFSSLNAAKALADTGTIPARQFIGSLGVGWTPGLDVGNQKQDISPAAAQCRKVMKDGGQDSSDATAFFYMTVECDAFLLLKQGLEHQTSFTPSGLRQGLEALGTSFIPAAVFSLAWRPGYFDGVTAVQDFRYSDAKFSYVGSPRPT